MIFQVNAVMLAASLASERDTSGVYGGIFHYAMIFAFMGSALLSFLYFWNKGCLDMDEEPKIQMMNEENKESGNGT